METGECSKPKPSDEVWAFLVPSDSKYLAVEIRLDETVICSEISSSSSDKHEWCKIVRKSDMSSATVENKSPNAIVVDDDDVHSDETVVIQDGSEIITGPHREGFLCYHFNMMPSQGTSEKRLKISMDIDHAKCSICLNIWHDVVTVAPCLHNFCNGCFSEWLRRSQEKHTSVLCPQCRAVVQFVGKNHFLQNISEEIVIADSSLTRSNEEIALLDSYSSIRSNLIIPYGKIYSRKRPHSPLDDDQNGGSELCRQCDTELGGFQCNQSTMHLQCHACGGLMPRRSSLTVPQHCVGCDRAFCGAYWRGMGISGSIGILCSEETFRPVAQHTVSRIPLLTHENNCHEQEITENCIIQMGKTVQDVISDWVIKLDNREIDRTRMPLNHAERITSASYICRDCYEKLVSFLLYWFRISIPKYLVPPDASRRDDCWYGYACRTQHHNEDHARKRNHVCRPTRGNT